MAGSYRALLTSVLVLGGCVPDRPSRVASSMQSRCEDVLRDAVAAMGPRGAVVPGPPGPARREELRVPVGELGGWVVWRTSPSDRRPTVSVVADGRVTVPDLAAALCAPPDAGVAMEADGGIPDPDARGSPMTPASPDVNAETFSDADLRSALTAHPRGVVVYVWAPHMPLSVDGYREIVEAAGAVGLTVEPVLFRDTDRAFARREAERVGMPRTALRELAAAELVYRDAQVHAPSIVVFSDDRISPVLPGYRDAAGYRRWLEGFLGR